MTRLDTQQLDELARVRRVADMLCTGHAVLRDRFARMALAVDLVILASSTWIVALAFVSSSLAVRLTPFGWDSTIWIGVLSTGTFFLTLLQIKTDWRGRSDAHKRTLILYAEVKREAGYLLASDQADEVAYRRVLARYDLASAVGVEIPERDFLRLKRHHKLKVLISKHLDDRPATSLILLRIRLWWNDNRPGRAK
jgi:hypothetical protein